MYNRMDEVLGVLQSGRSLAGEGETCIRISPEPTVAMEHGQWAEEGTG